MKDLIWLCFLTFVCHVHTTDGDNVLLNSMMSIQELEDFFLTHDVPEGTMLNAATVITDPDKYLEVNLDVIREWPRDLNKCPSYWHLCQLASVISGTQRPDSTQ